MKWICKTIVLFSSLVLISSSCENEQKTKPRTYTKEELMDLNREMVGSESDLIDAYVEKNSWNMHKTPTGLRYEIYHDSIGKTPVDNMIAKITYQAYLLDSTQVENTDITGTREFRIGHDPIISGIHEAVKLMSIGDSARVLIPSYLAHGLTGDTHIPSKSVLFYDISLVDIK